MTRASRLLLACALLAALTVAAVACSGSSNGSNSNGGNGGNGNTGDGAANGAGNGNDGAGNTNMPAQLPPFSDPWNRTVVGDQAVYRTPAAPDEGERWELTDDGIRITRTSGTDAMGFPEESIEVVPVNRDAASQWWSQPRPAAEPTDTRKLADGTELPVYVITDGQRTWVVSPDAPFDGVVEETVQGAPTPIRKLVSFSRPDSSGSGTSD